MERNSRPLLRHSEWEVLSADFADDAEGRKICAISVICGLYFIPNSAFVFAFFLNSVWDGRLGEKRRRAAAVQNRAEIRNGPGEREASWSAPALWRFGTRQWTLGARVVPTRSAWQVVDVWNCRAARVCGRAAAWDKPRSGQSERAVAAGVSRLIILRVDFRWSGTHVRCHGKTEAHSAFRTPA
jgi:hypothetical protein